MLFYYKIGPVISNSASLDTLDDLPLSWRNLFYPTAVTKIYYILVIAIVNIYVTRFDRCFVNESYDSLRG